MLLFLLSLPSPPISPLFPYTTLFRSQRPSPAEGGLIKRHWFRYWQPRGANLPPVVVRLPDGTYLSVPAIDNPRQVDEQIDRKSTRLNSSHRCISYAVFCLKKKK